MLLTVSEKGMLSTRNFLPLSENHQLLLCGEALKQTGDIQSSLMWLPSNMMLMSYGYEVASIYWYYYLSVYVSLSQSTYLYIWSGAQTVAAAY